MAEQQGGGMTRSLMPTATALLLVGLCLSACSRIFPDSDAVSSDESMSDAIGADACLEAELYDEEEDACYLDCTDLNDADCDALELATYGALDEFVNEEFSGPGAGELEPDYEEKLIAEYSIGPGLTLEEIHNEQPDDDARFRVIWDSVTAILPHATLQREVSKFQINTDGPDEYLAFVTQDEDNIERWVFAYDNVDFIGGRNPDFVHTTIHEFGHIVFLGNRQVDLISEASCTHFQIAEGCSAGTSFLNRFYQTFWSELAEEHASLLDPESDLSGEALTRFYERYPDHFVSEYAATNPVEDAAEVFTHFVLKERPVTTDTIIDRKIRSFHEHRELVRLRQLIKARLASRE